MYLNKIFELKSSIIWCEPKYTTNYYIAEFYNSISGLFFCFFSIYFYYTKSKSFYPNKLLFIIGIGTFLFHSTLLYIFQLVDELSMFFLSLEYIILFYPKIKKELTCYKYFFTFLIVFSYMIHPILQPIFFFAGFSLNVLFIIIPFRILQINDMPSHLFILAFSCWLIENTLCSFIGHWYLHTIWHILTSYGLYKTNGILYQIY